MAAERFDHFMARANAAYYATHDFSSDFTTAPELTQVFGELLGAWAKTVWTMMGAPADVMLVEAGPGRGTLMADALRVWPCANVHFIEASPRLRAEQAKRVPGATWPTMVMLAAWTPSGVTSSAISVAAERSAAFPNERLANAGTG